MPDLRQALKDFVATANSGKYPDEATLISKFPELQGYDVNALKDFVATANSGKYTNEDELFSKFPEFSISGQQPVSKKKVGTVLPSEVGSVVSSKQDEDQGWLLNTVSSLDKGFYKNLIGSPIKGLGTLLQGTTAKITGGTGKAFISDALIKFGDYFNKTIDELTPQDESFKGTLSDQFGQAFGQVASLVATGGATGAASKGAALVGKTASTAGKGAVAVQAAKTLGTELASPVAVSAGLSMGQSEFERAKQAGATDDQAFQAFYKNAAVGSVLEKIPVMQFMKRFNQASAGGISNYIKTKGVAGITGGLEEMTTEVLQQLYANKTAQDIYNTNQELFEGVGESGGVGFGVGFLLNAMGANAKLLRKQGKKDEADMVENQMKLFETQAENGGPSSYKLNGIKIESPEVISNLIDNMDANDLAKANIDIVNDPALKIRMQDKIITSSIKEQVRQGNPELNEPSLNAITELEKDLRKLEGNTTQTGKDKAAAIRGQIKNIQENQLQEEAVAETVAAEAPEVAQKRVDRIAELETTLSPESTVVIEDAERVKLETELETLKTEQDAIQKQATDEGVLRTEQPEVGLQQVVEGDQRPQVVTTRTQETITPEGTQEVVATETTPTQPSNVGTFKINGENATESQFFEAYRKQNEISSNGDYNPNPDKIEYNGNDNNIIQALENYERDNKTYEKDGSLGNRYMKWAISRAFGNVPFRKFASAFRKHIDPTFRAENEELRGMTFRELAGYKITDRNYDVTDEQFRKFAEAVGITIPERTEIVTITQPTVSSKTQAPKLVRDISVLITPATVREATPVTKRIKELSVKYDKLVKQFGKKKSKKTLDKIKEAESQILNDAKQEIINEVSKIDGVAVKFSDPKRGLWDGSFEPAFNMILSISPQANTEAVSKLLFDFAEKYSQDAFILETDSEYEADVFSGKRDVPLTEFDKNNLMHYPQIIYTFDVPITDEQVADLSNELENNGVDAFNINNNEIKISVIKFFNESEQQNLTEDEQYEERARDLDSKSISTEKATADVLGTNVKVKPTIRIKKSSYQGAKNEGTSDQTREFDRSDILKSFKESTTKVEELAVELADLRQKEIDLQKEGKKLSPEEQTRFNELNKIVQPAVQRTFETNKKLYEDAKVEVESIAQDAIAEVDASISPFPIKRPERASVKAIRWYNAFTEKLGDGARVNIVVDTEANADKVFKTIDEKYPGDKELRRITETTELGYPKRLIEIRTSNGTIAEVQVITNEAYLAKDGLKGFTGDEKQKATAKQKLDAVRARLGWSIPDGLGHYFYEIQRDTNVDEALRDEAARLSDLYYDAFTNPKSKLTESFMKDVEAFKKNVDAADKSQWDAGNSGKAPQSLIDYKPTKTAIAAETVVEEEAFEPITASDVKTPAFTRDNALFYEEDERETDSGRMSTYLSSVTVEATNPDEEPLGTITKITDEDKIFYFTAEDADGNELNLDGYETLGDAKKAIADSYNKIQKKEFDKVAKKKAKDKAKAEAKKAKAKAKGEFETKALKLAEDIDNFELPSWFTPTLPEGTQKAGLSADEFKRLIAKSVVEIGRLMDRGVEFSVALKEAIKEIVNVLGEAKRNNIEKTVTDFFNEREKVTEDKLPGYNQLMSKVDELIARQKSRGIADAKIISNLDTLIRNSEVYSRATDAQKKVMEREGRFKMGVGAKRAVSIGRVLGALKDITNITRAEKMLVIKRIRDLSRDAAKELSKEIREMAAGGKITAVQAANIVARFGKVNMLNEVSVSSFVDYMAKVFANAEYANKIDVAKSKLRAAKKNIVTKIGIADGLVGPLQRLFSINPTLIPDQYLDRYLELVDMFSARQAVLNLEEKSVVTKDVNDILNEIDNEQSKADELADRFNNSENKVFKDDELDYAASIKKMLDEKEIDEKEAETMRKYKEDIAPQVEETELTEEEAQQEKDELIAVVKASQVDGSELPSKDERDLAKEIARLIKTDALKGLTNTELKNLLKVIDNINNNYLPHYAQLMVEKMNAINNGKTLTNSIKNAKVAKFSGLYARIKSLITKKGAIVELIRRNPLFNIDQLFGDFKTKDIFNSVLNKAAEGEAKFSAELKKIQNILEKAEEKVAKSFKLDPNKTLMSKFKMMTYMIQLEYESNKGNKQVNPAANYLKATIKHIDAGKSQFGERDAEMLQDILDKYIDSDGNIDNEKLYNSFNQAEKDAIKDIRGVNESLRDKAEYTAAIIRGDRINPLNNYVHLNVLHEHQPNDLTAGSAFINEYNDSMRPSTKAKSLIARTGKVSPLNFDVFASAQRGAKFVLMDYNLTEPIRTARKTINQAIANLEKEGRIPKQKRDIINSINIAFEEAIENLLTNSYVSTSIADDAIDYINKQGYRAILAGTGRFISELTSNIGFAVISDPKAFIEGANYKGVIMSESAPLVMENVNSKQTNRIFPTDTLSGKLIDTSIIKQASGIKGGKSKNIVANKIQQIYNLTGKKYANVVELSADALISTPDKIIMRPMWFGSFANEFKKVSGKDVDFEKIAANDEKYMADNKEAIEQAKTVADERSVMTGATDNAFMGILKGTTKPNQSLLLRGFNNFNNFMTRFLIFEYVTARTAINAAIGNGSLTKKQGGALLGAVATRMMVYTLLTQMLGSGLMELAFGGEDEPEDEKSFMQKLGQSLASAFTSLTLGRDFGNASKGLLNYGVERANEKYLDFLREGDYDPYKDAIQYTIVPPERKGRPTDLFDYGINMLGSFGPAAKTTDLIIRKLSEPEKKEAAAIERQKKELTVRIPLEVLGNLGLVPLYKDVRKVVMKDMYKDLEQADENAENKRQIKLEKLQGYENESDMKRYDPELWEETFGPNAPEYDAEQAKKNIKKAKDSLERAMKDEMYNYTPKSKKGFGSAGFGSGKGKSKGGFGTSKFGQ
jgi:hypothetical protein